MVLVFILFPSYLLLLFKRLVDCQDFQVAVRFRLFVYLPFSEVYSDVDPLWNDLKSKDFEHHQNFIKSQLFVHSR